jgi:hypothetical protein
MSDGAHQEAGGIKMITKSTILLSGALIVAAISGAAAQMRDNGTGFGVGNMQGRTAPPAAAFAQSRTSVTPRNAGAAYQAYDEYGNVIGADPDGFIRNDLMRDPPGRGD